MDTTQIKGTSDEVEFWKGFVKTEQFQTWLDDSPTPELRPEVKEIITSKYHPLVLDVGSGVVSILHGLVDPRWNLIAADLLSEEYQKFFNYEEHNLATPVSVAAERMTWFEEFDVVHMSNALDHTQDPCRAFTRLVAALRPGGTLIIQGFENEGQFLHGLGMHQWSLSIYKRRLHLAGIGSSKEFIVLHDPLLDSPFLHETHPLPNGRNWIVWAANRKL